MTDRLALLGGEPAVKHPPQEVWPAFPEADVAHVAELVRAGEVSYDAQEGAVKQFEEAMIRHTGASHALAVNSGTSALHSAFFGLDLEPGDEVIAPTYTFHATVMPIFASNAVPVLADAEPDTGNLDPACLPSLITDRTRAIVVMHLNGYPVDMPAVMRVARRHGLKVVEDCSQAHGAECDGSPVGVLGDVAAFSLQSRKQVPAGAGGVLVTSDDRIFERAVLLGHSLGRAEQAVMREEYRRFATTGFGLNLRIHPVGAALAWRSLGRLDELLTIRQANCDHLDRVLDEFAGIRPPVRRDHMTRVAPYSHQPLYRREELDGLSIGSFVRAVAAEGVPLSRPRTPPLHQLPAFQDPAWRPGTYGPPQPVRYRSYRDGDLPRSEHYFQTALRMPVFSRDVRPQIDEFRRAFDKVTGQVARLRDLESQTPTR